METVEVKISKKLQSPLYLKVQLDKKYNTFSLTRESVEKIKKAIEQNPEFRSMTFEEFNQEIEKQLSIKKLAEELIDNMYVLDVEEGLDSLPETIALQDPEKTLEKVKTMQLDQDSQELDTERLWFEAQAEVPASLSGASKDVDVFIGKITGSWKSRPEELVTNDDYKEIIVFLDDAQNEITLSPEDAKKVQDVVLEAMQDPVFEYGVAEKLEQLQDEKFEREKEMAQELSFGL